MGLQRPDSEGAGDPRRAADGPYGGTFGQCDVLAGSGARGDPKGKAGSGRTSPEAGAAVWGDPCGGGDAGENLAGGWISGGGGLPEAVWHRASVYWGCERQPGGVSGVSKAARSATGGDQEAAQRCVLVYRQRFGTSAHGSGVWRAGGRDLRGVRCGDLGAVAHGRGSGYLAGRNRGRGDGAGSGRTGTAG